MAFRHARRPSFPSRLGTAVAALGFSLAMVGMVAPMATAATACTGGGPNRNLAVNLAPSSSTTFTVAGTAAPFTVTIYPTGGCDATYTDVTKLTINGVDGSSEEVVFDFAATDPADLAALANSRPGGSRGLIVALGTGTADTVVFDGSSGADVVDATPISYDGVDVVEMNGKADDDDLTAPSIATTFNGGLGDDEMNGGSGNDTFDEGASDEGSDVMSGGAGSDTVDYSARGSSEKVRVTIGAGSSDDGGCFNNCDSASDSTEQDDVMADVENVKSGAADDYLVGDVDANVLEAGDGDDHLDGGAGNDTLIGGDKENAHDSLIGGTGTDTASYVGSPSGVTVSLTAGAPAPTGGDAAADTLTGIENLTGSSSADKLTGDENANALSGGAGNDTIEGRAGADVLDGGTGSGDIVTYEHSAATTGVSVNLSTGSGSGGEATGDFVSGFEILTGSPKNDTLTGTSGEDEIHGGYGDDTLAGLGDGDVLDGGNGSHDRVSYAASAVAVEVSLLVGTAKGGDAADDVLTKIEDVTGSDFADLLIGSRVSNNISGGDGNDMISGGLGNDAIDGGAGKDTVGFASAVEGVTVSLRYGKATGGDGSDTLTSVENAIGSAYGDDIAGGRGVNVINGGGGSDRISGSDGNDRLYGGTGNDTLVGGAGDDVLAGGGGDDKLDAGDGTDSCNAGPGKNTLVSCEKLK